ncbi:MAG: hypothetical protein WDO15_03380 [Bacteroidota bacterium]
MFRLLFTFLVTTCAASFDCFAQDSTRNRYYNFQSTRYFATPSGFGLKPGEVYYQNSWIVFNQFGVGITKNISVNAGVAPLFILGDLAIPVWIMPKISFQLAKNVNLGTGFLYMKLANGDGPGGTGVAYSVLTFGNRHSNISLGGGYGLFGENFSHRGVFSLSTSTRLGPRGYLLTENYVIASGNGQDGVTILTLLGRRLMRRASLDFGIMMPLQNGPHVPGYSATIARLLNATGQATPRRVIAAHLSLISRR